jgi:hypothetical protein
VASSQFAAGIFKVMDVLPLTDEPGNFLFGFHDVCAWSPDGSKSAALRVPIINRPPIASDSAEAGWIEEGSGRFVAVCETGAYNFPQGNRQLWDPKGRGLWINHKSDDRWVATLFGPAGQKMLTADRALYAVHPAGGFGYAVNFARLHRLGGYGFIGCADLSQKGEPDGLWCVDLATGRSTLIIPMSDLVQGGRESDHYITHVVVSPEGSRLVFLHRYWLPDGGLHTRLMVCDPKGGGLRCLLEGFVTHFDWIDEDSIMIWARRGGVDKLRSHPLFRMPGVAQAARFAKVALKSVLGQKRVGTGRQSYQHLSVQDGSLKPVLQEQISTDGHPMFCPVNRRLLIVDTYPDAEGWRDLMLVDFYQAKIVDRTRLIEPKEAPDLSRIAEAREGMDDHVLRAFSLEQFAHTRSGLHCDLHPRWKPDGTAAGIDSRHEGGVRRLFKVPVALHD